MQGTWISNRIITVILFFWGYTSLAHRLHLAVAANFAKTAERIKYGFEKNTGHKVTLSSGSSGRIFSQIKNGAPFELFMAADQSYTSLLESQGLGVTGSRMVYAQGKLALVSRSSDLKPGPDTLTGGRWKILALANPELAPYGKAAVQVLKHHSLVPNTKARFVYGESVAQAFNYVRSGNADFGFVALAQILSLPESERGLYYEIPQKLYDPIRQELIVLKKGEKNPVVAAFIRYLMSKPSQQLIKESGYELPARHS